MSTLLDLLNTLQGKLPTYPMEPNFEFFKEHSPITVEQENFPEEIQKKGLPREYPCTDGETLWIPRVGDDAKKIDCLLHETGHALLHYPNGPDINFWDPAPNYFASQLEAEACSTAYLTQGAFGLPSYHNLSYLSMWQGDVTEFEQTSLNRILEAAEKLTLHYLDAYKLENENTG